MQRFSGIPNVAHGASEGEEDDDEGQVGELGTARSISETSSTAPCATVVDPYSAVSHIPRFGDVNMNALDVYL